MKDTNHKNSRLYDDICYSKLVDLNPHLKELVSRLNLVNDKTGLSFRKVVADNDYEFEGLFGTSFYDYMDLISEIINRGKYYSKMEIIAMIRDTQKVSHRTANDIFNNAVHERLIEEAKKGWYCLGQFMLNLDK